MPGARSQGKFRPFSQRAPSQWGDRQVNCDWIESSEYHDEGERGGAYAKWVKEAGTHFAKWPGYLDSGGSSIFVGGGEETHV